MEPYMANEAGRQGISGKLTASPTPTGMFTDQDRIGDDLFLLGRHPGGSS